MTVPRVINSSYIDTIACKRFQHMLEVVHCITSVSMEVNKRSDCVGSGYEILVNSLDSHIVTYEMKNFHLFISYFVDLVK
ncbi:hypothetical protein PBCV1_a272aR [Paramecium bursaria Chlorella virus 1]|uniref:Uncharacterized protein n=1 Tax=Paramecium bursaria Chlorella virus 1 TaxID=10506 RepID=F8TU11_PBCV1|nr:hypothetical protein PBCV1_a272aR [Paramecium bursaria Chlorella virus 1]AEI70072.1 hypothetical protein [Paramecium bursaria Chlorella virus 1]